MSACVRERERELESVYKCVCERESVCVCVYVCVCERESVRTCVRALAVFKPTFGVLCLPGQQLPVVLCVFCVGHQAPPDGTGGPHGAGGSHGSHGSRRAREAPQAYIWTGS